VRRCRATRAFSKWTSIEKRGTAIGAANGATVLALTAEWLQRPKSFSLLVASTHD
jgi:hypothetical protein